MKCDVLFDNMGRIHYSVKYRREGTNSSTDWEPEFDNAATFDMEDDIAEEGATSVVDTELPIRYKCGECSKVHEKRKALTEHHRQKHRVQLVECAICHHRPPTLRAAFLHNNFGSKFHFKQRFNSFELGESTKFQLFLEIFNVIK